MMSQPQFPLPSGQCLRRCTDGRLWLGHDEGSLHVGCSRHEQGGVDLQSLCFSEVPWRSWMGFFTSLELGRGDRSGLSTIRTQSHNSDRHP